jgi:hypothetical protein
MGNKMACNCEEKCTRSYECVICHKYETRMISEFDRTRNCDTHRVMMVCGQTEFVCASCTNEGWYSTAGEGGGHIEHINTITQERRQV